MAGRKIFVGSLPANIDDLTLRNEFAKFGQVEDIYIKPNCDPTRQWAFITFAGPEQAQFAKESCDRILNFPGAPGPCDVMLAKNQGMFGQDPLGGGGPDTSSAPKKIFVGSLPDGIPDVSLRTEFGKYGTIEEVFIKQGCEPGRQWAFITYMTHEEANFAAQSTNGLIQFAGAARACEVTLARNQGMFGQGPMGQPGAAPSQAPGGGFHSPGAITAAPSAPRKCFVGSLPDWINEDLLRAEFSRFGQVTEIFIKNGCETGRQWAFVTFTSHEEAQLAKESCDRILVFPGADKPCEVTLARNQGMFGQDPVNNRSAPAMPKAPTMAGYQPSIAPSAAPSGATDGGPRKIFVGSLPDGITENDIRAEFSRHGHVIDCFLKMAAQSGRHWAFVTFASAEQAAQAKMATDRILSFPGSLQPCEVMLAKNQGMFGQNSTNPGASPPPAAHHAPSAYGGAHHHATVVAPAPVHHQQPRGGVVAPPPPSAPPPAHLTPWREYKTVAGIPYYHNSKTGETTWECPPDLQAQRAGGRYSPY